MSKASRRYRRCFDKHNPHWNSTDPKANPIFVSNVQEELNDLLRSRGYVFLNEALEALGFRPVRWGRMLGWLRDPGWEEGDGRIYFGVWDDGMHVGKEWIAGRLDAMTISFNIDDSPHPLTYRVRQLREEGLL